MKKNHRGLRILSLLLVLSLLVAVVAGCSSTSSNDTSKAATRTVEDLAGNTVTIPTPENIERVAVLTSPTVQIMYIVGAQDKLCAMTASQSRFKLFEEFYPRQAEIPAPRKTAGDINMEALLNSDPQFCIGSEIDMNVIEKNSTIPTVKVATTEDPQRVFEVRKEEVRLFGKIFGKEDRAEVYCEFLDNMLTKIKEQTKDIPEDKKINVYIGFGADHLTTYGGDTYMQYLIAASGCRNAAEEISTLGGKEGGLANVSLEQVVQWDPDIIIIDSGNLEQLKKNPVWAKVAAVKNGNVLALPVGGFMWGRPSAESAALLPSWLAHKAYPDKFKDSSIENDIKKYWEEVIGFELSDEDVENILNPSPMKGPGGGGK